MNVSKSAILGKRIRSLAIVNFTGLRTNWGCQATSWELLNLLNCGLPPEQLPLVSLVPLLPRYDIDREIEQTQLEDIYASILEVCQGGPKSKGALRYLENICIERYREYADAVRRSDLVIFQAEGTMAGTDFLRGARLLLLPFVAKHAWSKPVFSLNQTILSCDDRFTPVMAAAFNTFDFVAVRENISFSAARNAGVDPVYHIPDAAFLVRPTPDDRLPDVPEGQSFAVTGSAWFSPEIHEQIFSYADKIRRATGLMPIVAASTGPDRILGQLAERHWGNGAYAVIPPNVHYAAAAWAMKRCGFLLGGRYHMAIMAMSGGVPAIQLRGNSYKNEGLSAMLDGLAPVRDVTDEETILADAARLVKPTHSENDRLADALVPVRRSLDDAIRWFAAVLQGANPDLPSSFSRPPGQPADASDHTEPYRTNAIDHAHDFSYPAVAGQGLGLGPTAYNTLIPLLFAYRGGDERALMTIRQILDSYPQFLATVESGLKEELFKLPFKLPEKGPFTAGK